MSFSVKKLVVRFLKVTGISLVSIISLLFILPYLFPATISNGIKMLVNNHLKGELNFSKVRLSFFDHFPSLTLTLYDCSLKGSAPFQADTLIACKQLSFGIDITTVFSKRTEISQLFLTKALINIQVDTLGRANYNVYASEKEQSQSPEETSNTSLRIKQIVIEDSRIVYHDRSLPMYLEAKEFNYTGKGRLNDAVFDLKTHAEIGSFDCSYNNTQYVKSQKVHADLVTHVNTHSLELNFSKNNLLINQLPVQFTGRFAFLKNGYDMDFKIDSKTTGLNNMVMALPPAYLHWVENATLSGSASINAELAGQYLPATNTMPGFTMNMSIRDGSVAYNKAPRPATNLFFDFRLKFPGFNTDSLQVDIDSLSFNIDQEYLNAVIHTVGIDKPHINARINTEMNLEQFDQAFGIRPFDIKGNYTLHLTADGTYASHNVNTNKKQRLIIDQTPRFTLTSTIDQGYFKLASMPLGVNNISFQLNATCPDSNYRHAQLAINNFNAQVLSNFVKGFIKINTLNELAIDANLQTKFHLADVQKVYPLDSLQLAGDADINIQTKGRYNWAKKIFPVTNASIKMANGSLQTAYYPRPINQINIDATIINTNGALSGTKVFIKPISFRFEEQPFMLSAGLQNLDNITYNIASKGRIDLGRIYKVFAYDGLDVKGYLETDLVLKGSQRDILTKHYDRLFNAGKIKVRDMVVRSDYFPEPFFIRDGTFRFKQDKVWFDQFHATYGHSDFALDGYLTNVIGYVLQREHEVLAGAMTLKGNRLIVDEFMAKTNGTVAVNSPAASSGGTATGVVMIPENLDILFTANIGKVDYNGLVLTNAKGQMQLSKGTLTLKETGFTLIDAPVVMDATYKNESAIRARFDYHIKATDFDISRAYREVKMFRDMATSAAGVQGIVSLDYTLKGRLDKDMIPVYPSLSGGGVLNINKVKLKGFKLMDALGNSTGRDQIKNQEVSGINIKSTITRNIMTIERVKLKIAGFRPRFQGQVSLDGQMNLTGRLGLPPLGILGIPFTVTGAASNPKIHLRRSKAGDLLQESADPDDTTNTEGPLNESVNEPHL